MPIITTQYKPRPNSNSGKIVAKGFGRQKSRPYAQELSVKENHRIAAEEAFATFLGGDAKNFVLEEGPTQPDQGHYIWVAQWKKD